ncbi:MFS-type transporter SLC18B1 [Chanos chanos]|uniref:MFS-type transporter SLC18B1 n=1 Tax=Chanos chanos TaxID=29144 RepID=A0A6J2WJR9_CHACN|nr:MFS-type transporter SLC18B1 [Chanos chanos]
MSRQQIVTILAMSCTYVSSGLCYSVLGPFFPKEAEKKGVSQTVIGLIFGSFAFFTLVGSVILGKYIAHIGAKFLIVAGLFISTGCTILFGILDRAPAGTTYIALCFVTRSINAVGFSGALTAVMAIAAKVFPNNIATVMGILEACTGLGLILGPPVGGWLYQAAGYEITFVVIGCIMFLTIPLNMYVLPVLNADVSHGSYLRLCTRIKILSVSFVVFMLSSGIGFLDATLSIFTIDKFGISPGTVGFLMLGMSLPYGLTSPALGIISDKYPFSRKWMMFLGGVAATIGFCFLGPLPIFHIESQLWLAVVMLILIALSLAVTLVPTFAEMLTYAYEYGYEENLSTLGLVSGLYTAVWSAGTFFGPIVGGYTTQRLGFEWAAGVQGAFSFLAVSKKE